MNYETIREFVSLLVESKKIDWKSLNSMLTNVLFDFDADSYAVAKQVVEKLRDAGYKHVGEGRNRSAFLSPSGKNVVKVPLSTEGFEDNEREARYWKKQDAQFETTDKIELARCRLFGVFLVMEFVDDNVTIDEKPGWANYIDCEQIGKNRKGRIVAYDYA